MKFENSCAYNFENALRGMRHPLESYNKSDSFFHYGGAIATLGENDLNLAQKLISAGSPHDKFMRQIFVSVDITAPLYWWKEADQYRICVTTNSQSTIHKLASTPITLDRFETDDYDGDLLISQKINLLDEDASLVVDTTMDQCANTIINICEALRLKYLETKDLKYWKALIRWLPESWLQTRTWTANYEVLRNIYFQRQGHKLTEWHSFCEWVESLPYATELITYTNKEK